jgi:ABC-type lipoprotein release transport system permease subunit
LLAAFGLHAVLSQVLLRRTPEIAIRVALGASRGGVLWLTVGDSLKWSLPELRLVSGWPRC